MKILQIKPDNAKLFFDMDPYFKLEWLGLPGTFAIAAIDDSQKDNRPARAGLMVCVEKKSILIIEWIYVNKAYRNRGIGEELLDFAFEYALKRGIARVGARLGIYSRHAKEYESSFSYFQDRLFSGVSRLPGEWITDLRTISENPIFSEKLSREYELKDIHYLETAAAKESIEKLIKDESIPQLFSLHGRLSSLDSATSSMVYKDGRLKGALLVSCVYSEAFEPEDGMIGLIPKRVTLYPVLFFASEAKVAEQLLLSTVKRAVAKCGLGATVRVVLSNDNASGFADKVCGMNRIDNYLLEASVEDYEFNKLMRR